MASTILANLPKLKGRENYSEWAFAIENYLVLDGLEQTLTGAEKDASKIAIAKSKLILSLEPVNYVHIKHETTAKGVWDKLKSTFAGITSMGRISLLRQLINRRLENCDSMEAYVSQVIGMGHELSDTGFKITNEWIGSLLLAGLPEKFSPMIMEIENSGIQITTDTIKTKLMEMKDEKVEATSVGRDLKGNKFQKKGSRCYGFSRVGNIKENWRDVSENTDKTEDLSKSEHLYKKVRGILNKLTAQKFNTLLHQMKTLPIDTSERLQGVIDLVFEKAVDEPNFSLPCALMCRELALMQVPVTAESKEVVNFRKLIVTRCQMEFENNSSEDAHRNDKIREIDECTDPEKKKEMIMTLEEVDRQIRMKAAGNIRFIGELFKQNMLTVSIIMRCLSNLIENQDDVRLECLSILLTSVGKELETKKVDLSGIFDTMKDIVDKKNGEVSNKVRFILQDVIDLRSNNWIPLKKQETTS